jgi:endogenous inhibitor of DNA gyrase (YacG/DUF329 family)
MVIVSRCLSCGLKVDQPIGKGRPRLYCSSRCRMAALRHRRAAAMGGWASVPAPTPHVDGLSDDDEATLEATLEALSGLPPDPDEAVGVALTAGWTAVRMFDGAGKVARREYAWRCIDASTAIAAVLRKHFEPNGS